MCRGAVVLHQPGHAVYGGDGDFRVVKPQPVAAGCQRKGRRADADEDIPHPGSALHPADIRNDEHHRQHRIGRTEIGDHIGDLREGQTSRHSQQKIAHIGRRHAAKQEQEILLPLLLPQKIRRQQKHRKHRDCTIYDCQITVLQWTASHTENDICRIITYRAGSLQYMIFT